MLVDLSDNAEVVELAEKKVIDSVDKMVVWRVEKMAYYLAYKKEIYWDLMLELTMEK